MIIDTSALISILRDEPESAEFAKAVRDADVRRLSAGNYLEASILTDKSGDPLVRAGLDALLTELQITVEPVSAEQARIARLAHRTFGRGSGHPARLNYGDCFAYALAKDKNEPLLFKGDDFAQTDIRFVGRRAERKRLSELIAAYGAT